MKLTETQIALIGYLRDCAGGRASKEDVVAACGQGAADAAPELFKMGLSRMDAQGHLQLVGRGRWPTWAIQHFPAQNDLAAVGAWEPITFRYPLHRNVLVVAKTRIEGAWKAYCGSVPGICHADEEGPVLESGSDVGEKIARVLFPHMGGIPYAP